MNKKNSAIITEDTVVTDKITDSRRFKATLQNMNVENRNRRIYAKTSNIRFILKK